MTKWSGDGINGSLALMLAGSLVLFGCGDDSDDTSSVADDSDDTTQDAGDTDGDDTPDAGGGPAGDDIPCGPTVCGDPTAGFMIPDFGGAEDAVMIPTVCCADKVEGICGLESTEGTCEPPADNHEVCPPLVTGLGLDGTSCCIEKTNECGLVDTLTGTGACTSLTEVNASVGALAMGLISIPAPVDCEGNPIVGGGDVGVDAGDAAADVPDAGDVGADLGDAGADAGDVGTDAGADAG